MYCCGTHITKSISMLLLRALMKAVQSVATIKFALDRSVYRSIRQDIGSK